LFAYNRSVKLDDIILAGSLNLEPPTWNKLEE